MLAVKRTVKTTRKPALKAAKKVTIDDVWAAIKATTNHLQETSRIVGDLGNKVGDIGAIQRAHEETEKALKETQRIVGDLGNRFGDIAEKMLVPNLIDQFEQFGFTFGKLSHNIKWKHKDYNLSMELDALLENGKQAMVVEVKAKLDKADVDEQIRRMEKVRCYADLHGDTRQFFCAMAALSTLDRVIKYALSKDFYLIMPSGENVKVTKPVSEKVW